MKAWLTLLFALMSVFALVTSQEDIPPNPEPENTPPPPTKAENEDVQNETPEPESETTAPGAGSALSVSFFSLVALIPIFVLNY